MQIRILHFIWWIRISNMQVPSQLGLGQSVLRFLREYKSWAAYALAKVVNKKYIQYVVKSVLVQQK